MRVYEAELARAVARDLRELADMVDAGEVKYMATFATLTLEGAKKHGYAFDQQYTFIETIGHGEFALVLGGFRSFYLDVEKDLLDRWAKLNKDLGE